jgi:hypothetical protein
MIEKRKVFLHDFERFPILKQTFKVSDMSKNDLIE